MRESQYINGQWCKGHGVVFASLNPATGAVLWEGNGGDKSDVDQAMGAAHVAFGSWAAMRMEERKGFLNKWVDCLDARKEEFAVTISQEMGKPLWESKTEVGAMMNKVAISFEAYQERCLGIQDEVAGAIRRTRFKPHGVMGVLGPFNLPGHLPNGHIIPALLAGNTIVFKSSEHTPLVGVQYAKCWQDAGLPDGVFNLIQGGGDTGRLLCARDDLSGLLFTGSFTTGQAIHKAFGGHPEKILALEMGGNNPLIVEQVKGIKAAAYMTIQSAFVTAGQRCVCARRLIVTRSKNSEDFLSCLVEMSGNIKVGAFTEMPEPFMGPVISKAAADSILEQQERLQHQGGRILLEMKSLQGAGCLLSAGIIDVTDIEVRKDVEIFGPLLQVIRVRDIEEAIEEANRTAYGLSAGILSDDKKVYARFLQLSRAGIINWNRPITGASSRSPFGGVGHSGNHRPSAYFAPDYCAYPVASMESETLVMPQKLAPGIDV